MKRKKKRKLKKSVKKLLILIPIIAVIAMVCVYGFALKDVSYSSDLQQYSAEEVKAYLNAKKIDNTLLFWIKNKIGKSESIDLFEEYTVKMQNPMKVKIISYEKKLKGYIKIYNSFYQVDEDGKFRMTAPPTPVPSVTITEFYGEDPKASPDFGRIINDRHFERLCKLLPVGTFTNTISLSEVSKLRIAFIFLPEACFS